MASEYQCPDNSAKPSSWRHKAALIVFLSVSLFYLVLEHTVHLFGLVSYFLVLGCPLMHFFHHAGDGIPHEHKEHSR